MSVYSSVCDETNKSHYTKISLIFWLRASRRVLGSFFDVPFLICLRRKFYFLHSKLLRLKFDCQNTWYIPTIFKLIFKSFQRNFSKYPKFCDKDKNSFLEWKIRKFVYCLFYSNIWSLGQIPLKGDLFVQYPQY